MTSSQASGTPGDQGDRALLELTRERLGPYSVEALDDPETLAQVRAAIADGKRPLDAILAQVHGRIGDDPLVENEFAHYILPMAMRMGHLSMPRHSRLRRFLNSGDLADSVLGNLWPDMAKLRFESESSFARLLAQRMMNKARDHANRLTARKRSEPRRVSDPLTEVARNLPDSDPATDPVAQAMLQEQRKRLGLLLQRLGGRDQEVLTFALQGLSRTAIAERLGMKYDAVRMALARAVKHARELGGEDG